MPKLFHEALVQLIRAAPQALVRLLPPSLGLEGAAAALIHVTADELVDLHLAEYRSDVVVVLGDAKAPHAGLITEVQMSFDADKRWTWPVQAAGLWARLRCPVALIVFALDDAVAAVYRQPIDLGWGLIKVTPIVIGRTNVPVITDIDEARICPELAVLSAMAHGNQPGAERIALAALVASDTLDNDGKTFYPDFVYAALAPAARTALEALMTTPREHIFYSDIARSWYDKGWTNGEAKGEAKILLKLLHHKGFSLSPEQQARIDSCTDPALIETWADRLLAANSLADVFG
jgi:hypothetical protein